MFFMKQLSRIWEIPTDHVYTTAELGMMSCQIALQEMISEEIDRTIADLYTKGDSGAMIESESSDWGIQEPYPNEIKALEIVMSRFNIRLHELSEYDLKHHIPDDVRCIAEVVARKPKGVTLGLFCFVISGVLCYRIYAGNEVLA